VVPVVLGAIPEVLAEAVVERHELPPGPWAAVETPVPGGLRLLRFARNMSGTVVGAVPTFKRANTIPLPTAVRMDGRS
jgi:hypothetical protein